ncbi:CrcB family protein [Klebsiella pneumoniae]|uniref:fluoride efflux transporter FluC n=1 Tax=Klebsiella pneumoniae TaxID=573 RepID=UPI00109109AB|nr:CrcB family protein [Klebsiella pneumoniae]MCJ3068590.1 CrcB family protein [Klebsiella pneumoniae]VGL51404.1 chromosome condensation protein CrcB [Klebsiella pneumoniae]HBX6371739.1 CrcB family protein [Klebsiella pneumoniae]
MVATDIFWVGLGGGTGSLLRWWVGLAVSKLYRGHFPLGTFLINVSGALIIGYLSALFGIDWRERYGEWLNAGLLTGVLGGYTTFSSMQLDAANLAHAYQRLLAAGYLIVSVVTGVAAAACGAWLACP